VDDHEHCRFVADGIVRLAMFGGTLGSRCPMAFSARDARRAPGAYDRDRMIEIA
jgi:hypothetical protein